MSEKGLCPICMMTLALCLYNEQNLHQLQLGSVWHRRPRHQGPSPALVSESQTQVPEK